ncbi:MAG: hypothetical protein ACO1SX_10305, partial [Actinomycetota bacterium]
MQSCSHLHGNGRLKVAALAATGTLAVTVVALAAAPAKPRVAPQKSTPAAAAAKPNAKPAAPALKGRSVRLAGPWKESHRLAAGETVEISVHLDRPSALPTNGRIAAAWTLDKPTRAADVVATPQKGAREVAAMGIYTAPTANWRKVLHALDGDVYVIYRAPVAGTYTLSLAPVVDEAPIGAGSRWREKGSAPDLFPPPSKTPWPAGAVAAVSVAVKPIDVGTEAQVQKLRTAVEVEPNDTPEQAQPLTLEPTADVTSYEVTGTSDDIEFFDNGKDAGGAPRSGDDWFRIRVAGKERKLVTAQLAIPGQ